MNSEPSPVPSLTGAVESVMWRLLAAAAICGLVMMLTASLSSCVTAAPKTSLFERLGGMSGVAVIASETIDKTAADPRTARSWEGIKLRVVKDSLAQQLCALTGGPCQYEGETMRNSHQASKITDTEFDLMVGFLRETLDRHVGTTEKNELLRLLAPMKRDIVTG